MTEDDSKELEELREWKRVRMGSAVDRSFKALEIALEGLNGRVDGVLSCRAFRLLADCLLALKDETRR